ncbi:hypothetical protein BKA56DRAFT_592736 [Ilyonectria sp. MPI-CAGE-AT-0026]|nr:hypothetical protein BKA56DRAFT_592736 [Ilyonectria sp. MPI-CAGE-AT-0026]
MPQRLPPTYPTLAWPLGMYFYSMGGLKPTGPNVSVAIECATTSALGYFLPGLHSQLLGVSSTPDADGLYSVLADDELPNWFNAVLGPMPDLNALRLLLHDPTAPTFDDVQLTLSLFGGSLVFSASAVPAAFPKTITPITSVVVDSSTVILGLDPTKSSQTPLSTTTQALLTYLGIARKLPFVLNLTLDCAKSLGQRNAIWFSPCSSYATTFRSVWTVSPDSGLADLNTFLGKFGLGIQIAAAEVIAVKKVTWDRAQPQYQDSSLTVGLTVTINGTDLSGYMELNEFSTSLQVICDNGPSVTDLVDWVVKPFANQPPAGSAVKGWVEQIGKNIKSRRLAVTLDGTNNDALTHCEVDFEVDMTIGQPSGAPGTVASLFSFAWSAGSGMALSGNFMPKVPAPLPFDPVILPSYEDYLFLQPDAPDAVDSIALQYLIPGLSIVDNPSTIEVIITAASFTLSKTEVNFTAVLSTDDSALAASDEPAVPHLRLGLLRLAATWSKTAGLILSCDLQITLSGKAGDADSRESMLIGSLVYTNTPASRRRLARNGLRLEADSTSSWLVSAHIQDLNVGTLYELFDGDSQDGVLSLIGHIDIASLDLVYNYSGGNATDFVFSGILLIDVFELALTYEYPASGKWQFHANLSIQSPQPSETMTLGQLVTHLQSGDSVVSLPGFVGNIVLSGDNVDLDILVQNTALASNPTVFVVVDLKIDAFQVLFVQFQEKGDPNPKRLFRAAVTSIPQVNGVPIIDHIAQPFDEMYFLYASVGAGSAIQGISKAELDIITNLLPADAAPLVVKSMSAKPQDADILITPGAHFVIGMTVNNIPTAILDYAFDADKPAEEVATTSPAAGDPTDNGSGKAALKKTLGPLTLDSIGLSYQDGSLGILLDATFTLGPIMLTLIGFRLAVPLTGNNVINSVLTPVVSINGLALSFNQPPTSAAGMFEQLSDALYAGGLTATFAPYALSAAGAYGTITDASGNTFKTVAVFAQCQGPIIELEFAQVSGVVLGFGYNSHLTLPTVDSVTQFPIVGTNTTPSGTAIDIFDNLQHQSPVWVVPQEASDWIAAGLSMTALATLAVNAVVVIEFDPSVKLGIYADAVATFPNKASEKNFVYVELGIAGTVDFAAGSMLVQAKLAPSSYILDPSCHLTGGFGLGYWFGSSAHAGDFVFTLGGFHPAYAPPAHYPVPDRLAISWSLDGCLSITGASYAAVTPKAVMAGGMLLAALSLGPLSASFSAWADFLLNWEPFFFEGDGGVSVHVEFTLDLWIVTIHIDVEIGANLHIQGPSTAGTVHVDFWVFGFDIDFGSSGDKPQNPMLLNDFYTHILLQQSSSGPQGTNQHTVTCTNGLVPDTHGQARTAPAAPWKVRGGVFAFVVKSVFPFTLATIDDGGQAPAPGDTVNPVLSKPMWRTASDPLDSTVKVSVFQQSTKEQIPGFQATKSIAQLPTAIWGDYTQATDPIFSGNQISSLLNGDDPTMPLMNGLTILAPKPNHSQDQIPAFNVLVSNQDNVNAGTTYNQYNVPHCDGPWAPKNAVDPKSQYELVVSTWTQPAWSAGVAQKTVEMWATLWAGPGETPPVMMGSPPNGLFADNAAAFDLDYLVPPLVSV